MLLKNASELPYIEAAMSSIKPLPIDLRDHLGELTGNEFKVWMYYYLLTGDYDPTSHPSNETIEAHTGISKDTVKTCKAKLRVKGWLAYTGVYKQPRRPGGKYGVPVMEVRLPWRDDWSAVVTDVSMAYDAMTVVEKTTHGTVVENFHPEGSCSGSGYGSSSVSSSISPTDATTLSDSNKCRSSVGESKENIKAKSEPENLEPTSKPTPTPTPSKASSRGHGQDGTPYPEHFDDWSNLKRLHWLQTHGKNQSGRAQAAWQKTDASMAGAGKPSATASATANSLARAPRSATPPNGRTRCYECGGVLRDTGGCKNKWCYRSDPLTPVSSVAPAPKVLEQGFNEDELSGIDIEADSAIKLDDWEKL
jgi:hypothetical protein